MPKGPGTYGSKLGRPPKPRVKKKRGGTAKGKSSLTKKDNLSLLVTKKPKTKMIA